MYLRDIVISACDVDSKRKRIIILISLFDYLIFVLLFETIEAMLPFFDLKRHDEKIILIFLFDFYLIYIRIFRFILFFIK